MLAAVGTTSRRNKLQQMSHFLQKNQFSTIFCLTGIMWQKSAQGEIEQNTWLLINWLSRSLDSLKPQRFLELLVPSQLTCKTSLKLHGTSERLGPGFLFEFSVVLLQKHGWCILLLFQFLRKKLLDPVLCTEAQSTNMHRISSVLRELALGGYRTLLTSRQH